VLFLTEAIVAFGGAADACMLDNAQASSSPAANLRERHHRAGDGGLRQALDSTSSRALLSSGTQTDRPTSSVGLTSSKGNFTAGRT
jgi:hypothetical protein